MNDAEYLAYEMHRELARAEQREIDRRVERARAERSHMSTTDRLDEIEARLSESPAAQDEFLQFGHEWRTVHGTEVPFPPNYSIAVQMASDLSRARADLAALAAVVREVEALHWLDTWSDCGRCHVAWPCPTAAAVQKLGGAS